MAILRSNSGGFDLTLDLCQPAAYAHDAGFEAPVGIRGVHWDGDRTHPVTTAVEGLWLRAADLLALRDHIAGWFRRPLDQLTCETLDGAFELARLPGQSVAIKFGMRPDTIAHFNPVVSISIQAGPLRSECHFVTDQSCLGAFVTELSDELCYPPATVIGQGRVRSRIPRAHLCRHRCTPVGPHV